MSEPIDHALAEARAREALPAPELRRLVRERAGISQSHVGTALGVDRASVSRYEAGLRTPRGEVLLGYCALLDRLAASAFTTSSTDNRATGERR